MVSWLWLIGCFGSTYAKLQNFVRVSENLKPKMKTEELSCRKSAHEINFGCQAKAKLLVSQKQEDKKIIILTSIFLESSSFADY